MGFRTVYGRTISENGWRMCDAAECDNGVVPGTSLKLPIRRGDANTILKGFVAWFNRNVENLNNPGRGYSDEGSFTWTNSVASSNHLSGTAVDLNWNDHAFRVSYSGFTGTEIAKCREGLRLFENTIWWGQDWASPKDAMHFQLNLAEGNPKNAVFAKRLREGYLGIWTGTPPPVIDPTPAQPGTPLLQYGSFGPAVSELQRDMNRIFPSYPGMPLTVDGDFGPLTLLAVRTFQSRVGIDVDGIVGPETWSYLNRYGVKL